MILSGRPKNGYGTITTSTQRVRQLHCGKGLVDRVKRPREEAGLLPSNNRNSLRVAEPFDVVKSVCPGPDLRIYFYQRIRQLRAVCVIACQNSRDIRLDPGGRC